MVQITKNGSEVAQLTSSKGCPKTDVRYWQKTIFQRTYRKDGQNLLVGHYSARVQHGGRRAFFGLEGQGLNRAAAAERAREIYLFLLANGWEATLAKFKPSPLKSVQGACSTVGDLIDQIRATGAGRGRTLEDYIRSFRHIVADIFAIPGGTSKYDYRSGGRALWIERVNAASLVEITPVLVQKWKKDFLAQAGKNPLKARAARISVNSFLRQAKSLFAPKHLKFVTLSAGFTSPFSSVQLEPRQSMRYQSAFNLEKTLAKGLEELSGDTEALKALLLAALAGLRRNEIDKLPWNAFNWDRGTLRVTVTEHFGPKSADSVGEVDLDPELLDLFREFKVKSSGPFVISSPIEARPLAGYSHYRCEAILSRLTSWLTAHGVPGNKPLHTLRKEFGSRICELHGIYAASRALRHADIAITSQHYLDKKAHVTIGLGHLLKGKGVPKAKANALQRQRSEKARTGKPAYVQY
jgi:integrase